MTNIRRTIHSAIALSVCAGIAAACSVNSAPVDPCPGLLACPNGKCCPSGYPFDCNGSCYASPPTACGSSYVTCGGNGAGNGGTIYVDTVVPLSFIPTTGIDTPATGRSYAAQFSAQGGRPPHRWTVSGGALPVGLTLDPSGLLTGTTNATGSFSYDVTVTDATGAQSGGTISGTLNSGSSTLPFVLASFTLPPYGLNQDFGFEPAFEGGTPPYTFTVTGLPPGITYDPLTGTLMGTPSSAGSFDLSISLKDALGNVAGGTPASAAVVVRPPQPVGGVGGSGGGGGSSGGAFNCAPYDAPVTAGPQYAGIFAYDWIDNTVMPAQQGSGSFRVSFSVKCIAPATNGSIALAITTATGSDPYFGTVGYVAVSQGSVLLMPANPPTTPSNPAQVGQGLIIQFPNGASLGTSNGTTGDFSVLGSAAPFKVISNGPAPTWSLVNASATTAFTPPGHPNATITETDWNFDHL